MTDPANQQSIIAALDIGTNSFHLVVARRTSDGFEVITREKEMIRLGHRSRPPARAHPATGLGTDLNRLEPEAIDRAVESLRRMRQLAESHGARTLRAVATSATREASNAAEFIERARREAGVEIEVISGLEEARLIHLGILQAVPVFDQRVLCIDIGGGSTELLIGRRNEILAARSFKLGAVRLTDRFFPEGEISKSGLRDCRSHIRSVLTHFDREIAAHGFETVVASSGTAESIARIVHLSESTQPLRTYNCYEFSADAVHMVTEELCALRTAVQRSRIVGLDSNRADIAPAGALILDEIVRRFGVETIQFSEAALRDGVLLDTAQRIDSTTAQQQVRHLQDVARTSVRQLQERCDDDPAHSAQVARLALQLFDRLQTIHGLGPGERDYLEAAALLANVGLVISHSKHHLHSYYVIRNSELAGLTDHEIEIIALIARYHRKSAPKPTHAEFAVLSAEDQQTVRMLAAILRVAIGLDRCHEGRIAEITVSIEPDRVHIEAIAAGDGDLELELYAAEERSGLLGEVTMRQVEITAAT